MSRRYLSHKQHLLSFRLQKFYKKMSEMKPEVEYVIKTGRQVVDKRQVDFPDKLNAQIDGIKQQYNELGQQVRPRRLTSRLTEIAFL